MKKITKLVTIAIVAAVGLGLCSMQGCEKKSVKLEKWECTLHDGAKIILDMYIQENKYYSTVSEATETVLFKNEQWVYYRMDGNRMYITKMGDIVVEPNPQSYNWIISKPTKNTMLMKYGGILPAIPIQTDYEFHLKSTETL